MSEWIVDRLPTAEDAPNGRVLAMWCGQMVTNTWNTVHRGEPWMRLPAPYVKPKRWTVKYDIAVERWILLRDSGRRWVLPYLSELGSESAQRIADVYNEVEP